MLAAPVVGASSLFAESDVARLLADTQTSSPADASLFNTLVTSLSKCLAHQASISASFTAFLGLKCRNFYLSHLPAYFSQANKDAMLAAPVVGASSLFAESDVARLLADTQTSSPADASLFNTLVTSLSKCLAHQASISASFTAFLGLKCRNFYLSHLPAYFS